MNFFEIGRRTITEESSIEFAQEINLVDFNNRVCTCGGQMRREAGKKRHGIDSRWRCALRSCRNTQSLWAFTIFNGAHLSPSQIIQLIFLWSSRIGACKASFHIGATKRIVCVWYKLLRRICILAVSNTRNAKIGGVGLTVEMDETHIYKRKYNIGRVLMSESVWIIGGRCRETGEVFLKTATRRNIIEINRIISENIHIGTKIITDCWKGYNDISENGYIHATVNHRYNFVCPEDRTVHTNNIERLWRDLKSSVPKSSRLSDRLEYVDSYLFDRIFPSNNDGERFEIVSRFISLYFNGRNINS